MNKEEYYNRVKKTRSKVMTDRMSVDEEYKMICQINYLNNQYIKTLEQALEEIEKWLKEKAEQMDTFNITQRKETGAFWFSTRGNIDYLLQIIKKVKGE